MTDLSDLPYIRVTPQTATPSPLSQKHRRTMKPMTPQQEEPPHRNMDPVTWASNFHCLYAKPCPHGYEPVVDPLSHDWQGQFPAELQDSDKRFQMWEACIVQHGEEEHGSWPYSWHDFYHEWGDGEGMCHPNIQEALQAWIDCFYRWWDSVEGDDAV